ncbi:MAG: hypothetical protein Q7N50_03595 [Armatimonadota bacterium]|nr:hypothetical protein [Armatimonadota bacterium]
MAPNWLEKWRSKVKSEDDCVRFVNDVGFCAIDIPQSFPGFPNQADAMGLESAIGHTWFWKDDLHIQKRLFYTRLFFNRPGYISIEFLPAFIATNGQVADELMLMGRMPVAQRVIYEAIEKHGHISTRDLKQMLPPDAKRQASSALIALERLFIITKTDITGRTMQTYSYVWDLAERWAPEKFEEADRLGVRQAKEMIREKFRQNGLPDEPKYLEMAFGWE